LNLDNIVVHQVKFSQIHKQVKILNNSNLLVSKVNKLDVFLPVYLSLS
jgi:hypothetical protein